MKKFINIMKICTWGFWKILVINFFFSSNLAKNLFSFLSFKKKKILLLLRPLQNRPKARVEYLKDEVNKIPSTSLYIPLHSFRLICIHLHSCKLGRCKTDAFSRSLLGKILIKGRGDDFAWSILFINKLLFSFSSW